MQEKVIELPFVSVIIPTYNAERFLASCLRSIAKQNYPKSKYEIIIIDGGSSDKTRTIANRFSTTVLHNPKRDAESGKAIGLQKARGEIIALIDADNELIQKTWLREMVKPLMEDKEIFGVESPWKVRGKDSLLNQYFALLRIADPLARRFHPLFPSQERRSYTTYEVKIGQTPVIGANGFLYRKRFIDSIGYGDKFEEVNFVARLVRKSYARYAVPKSVGIYHHYVSSLGDYIKKRIKIGRKFLTRKQKNQETWVDQIDRKVFLMAVLYNVSIVGPCIEAAIEYRKSKNIAWLWHPVVSFLTIIVYFYIYFYYLVKKS